MGDNKENRIFHCVYQDKSDAIRISTPTDTIHLDESGDINIEENSAIICGEGLVNHGKNLIYKDDSGLYRIRDSKRTVASHHGKQLCVTYGPTYEKIMIRVINGESDIITIKELEASRFIGIPLLRDFIEKCKADKSFTFPSYVKDWPKEIKDYIKFKLLENERWKSVASYTHSWQEYLSCLMPFPKGDKLDKISTELRIYREYYTPEEIRIFKNWIDPKSVDKFFYFLEEKNLSTRNFLIACKLKQPDFYEHLCKVFKGIIDSYCE